MDLKVILLSEVSQKEKDKCHMISLTCGIQKMLQVNLFIIQKHIQTQKTNLWLTNGKGRERDKLGVWD